MIARLNDPGSAEGLFGPGTGMMLRSCLQGVMGAVYGDRPGDPRSVAAVLGDFCFFAGRPDPELIRFCLEHSSRYRILVPRDEAWEKQIAACLGGKAKKIERYAIRAAKDGFSKERLRQAAAARKPGCTIRMIDEKWFPICRESGWSRDLVSQFAGYEQFRDLGLGVVAVMGEIPVAGASSYARCAEGIEIEIDTKEEYRRQGLAFACGAALILECLRRGLYPGWDAHDKRSAALAEKLGYRLDHGYPAFEVWEE